MTREEAIYWIKNLAVLSTEKDMASITEALNMAIAALKQLSLPKIIIRQGEQVDAIPSADRPTGHWIEHDDERVLCECSECHEKYLLYEEHVLGRNFCPNCGCAMEGGEEE